MNNLVKKITASKRGKNLFNAIRYIDYKMFKNKDIEDLKGNARQFLYSFYQTALKEVKTILDEEEYKEFTEWFNDLNTYEEYQDDYTMIKEFQDGMTDIIFQVVDDVDTFIKFLKNAKRDNILEFNNIKEIANLYGIELEEDQSTEQQVH